jgi:hypothetical protein
MRAVSAVHSVDEAPDFLSEVLDYSLRYKVSGSDLGDVFAEPRFQLAAFACAFSMN